MGAAVGKASEYLAGTPKTQAAARLACAEHALLQWNRSPGADSGIWDADAKYTNRGLLSAVDEVIILAEEDPFPVADSSARRRLDGAVAVAVSRMVEEFMRVRVWDASQMRVAVDRLSLASSGASVMVFPSAGDRTSTASTGGELDSSDGSQSRASSSVPDEIAALMDGEFLDKLALIRPAGVSVLHEIAQRVVRADCTKELLRAFANAPCDVLDSFLSILRVECSRQTTETVIKRWSTVTKLLEKAVVTMRRQLYAQSSGAFDGFRDEYLLTIAESRVLILLKFADDFTTVTSYEKILYILGMYEALSDSAPGLLLLFSGARKQRVSDRTQDILAKLADVVKTMVSGLMAKIQSNASHTRSAADGGVHQLTRDAMAWVELLARHRTVLGLILASGGVDAPAGAAEAVTSFGGLIAELVAALERNLEAKSGLIQADAGGSAAAHLFLANNISYVLNRAADADVASLLGDEWVARHQSQLERHAVNYAEASWGPVVACLETGTPAKALAKFNAAFKKAHRSQVCREVPDPTLRAALRKSVAEMVVPAYIAFLQKHPKLEKSVIYSGDDLAESLLELFEGDTGEASLWPCCMRSLQKVKREHAALRQKLESYFQLLRQAGPIGMATRPGGM